MTTRRTFALLALVALVTTGRLGAQSAPAVDVSGGWALTVEMSMGVSSPTIDLKQNGDALSGIYVSRYGDFPLTGRIKGRVISFSFTMRPDDPITITYTGEVASDGRTMKGQADLGEMGDATWTATRAATK